MDCAQESEFLLEVAESDSGVGIELGGVLVNAWLDRVKPSSTTQPDHEAYVVARNANARYGEPKLVLPATIYTQLGISWDNVLAVAREEKSLEQAQRGELGDHTLCEELPLVGTKDIALLTGRVYVDVTRDAEEPKFAVPVARVSDQRAWLIGDVRAYYDTKIVRYDGDNRETSPLRHLPMTKPHQRPRE